MMNEDKTCYTCAWWDCWTGDPMGWCRKHDKASHVQDTCEEWEEPSVSKYQRDKWMKRYKEGLKK